MRVLVFNIVWYNFASLSFSNMGSATYTYVLVIDRTCSSLYEVRCSIGKYLSRNLIRYIIQQRTFAKEIPDKQLLFINNLFSLNIGTNEVISLVKEKLSLFTKSMQKVGYIYEIEI